MANVVIDGDTRDGSLYTYNIFPAATTCRTPSATTCYTDSVASIGSYGGFSYPDRVVLLTNETEITQYWVCGVAGSYQECHTAKGYLYFDTSGLAGKTITAVKIGLYITDSHYSDSYGVAIAGWEVRQDSNGVYPHDTLEVGDYDKDHYSSIAQMTSAELSAITSGDYTPNMYVELAIPVDAINTDGWTKLCLAQYSPIEWKSGILSGYFSYQTADGANAPYLDIDYTTPVSGVCSMASSSSMAVTAGAIRSAVVNLQSISSMAATPAGVLEAFATMLSTSSMTATATLTLGEFLRWLGTLGAGDTLVLNCGQRRVTLNGANALKDIRGQWVSLAPGDNAVTLADTEASRTIDVEITHSPRWA